MLKGGKVDAADISIADAKVNARPISTNIEETKVLWSAQKITYQISNSNAIANRRLAAPANHRYGAKTKVRVASIRKD